MFAGISDAKIDPNAIVGVWLFDGDEDNIAGDYKRSRQALIVTAREMNRKERIYYGKK